MADLRSYAVVTGTYWVFTLTDGALRMLVLLHLHELGYAPLEIASMFLLYELFGVITNGLGGWIGARHGLRSTLLAGLALQIGACALLAARAGALGVPVLLVAQAASGIAKDLTKMSSKSYVKLVVPREDRRGLMRLVAVLTGSKNALKGAGFFLGGLLLSTLGFRGASAGMAAALAIALGLSALLLPPAAGRAKARVSLSQLVAKASTVRWLSAARLFLFGARDIWFVLALPLYLASVLGWSHPGVGAFLAAWVIGYGFVQAAAPAHVGRRGADGRRLPPDARQLGGWTVALALPLAGMLAGLFLGLAPAPLLFAGLALFGLLFATCSAVHSYLIVAYTEAERVALDVGFYYMSNAAGRLVGTVLSGALFQAAGGAGAGLSTCLAGSLGFVLLSALLCVPLRSAERRAEAAPA